MSHHWQFTPKPCLLFLELEGMKDIPHQQTHLQVCQLEEQIIIPQSSSEWQVIWDSKNLQTGNMKLAVFVIRWTKTVIFTNLVPKD